MPAARGRSTTWRTADSASRARRAGSTDSPRSWLTSRSRRAGGRGRLPTWVVRMRVSLRFMPRLYRERASSARRAFHDGGEGQDHTECAESGRERGRGEWDRRDQAAGEAETEQGRAERRGGEPEPGGELGSQHAGVD